VTSETSIGQSVRRARKRLLLTQSDLAASAGVMLDTLSRIERGLVDPWRTTIEKIAKALDLRVEDLTGASAPPLRPADQPMIDGEWFAAWQTSVDRQEIIATQPVVLDQRGLRVRARNLAPSEEHPKGGYLWKALLHRAEGPYLHGHFQALSEETSAKGKGVLHFQYRHDERAFAGIWSGASHDGDVMGGYAAMAPSREQCRDEIATLIAGASAASSGLPFPPGRSSDE